MKSGWLNKKGNSQLLLFCTGWGMDGEPMRPLQCGSYDVLVCYDYSDKANNDEIVKIIKEYPQCILIGWSMGVFFAQKYFADHFQHFSRRIAVNGTLRPVDDLLGIPEAIFRGTLDNLNTDSRDRFYRRMCKPEGGYEQFMANKPLRSLKDQKNELQAIAAIITAGKGAECASRFTDVIVSDRDLVMPTKNQMRFWQDDNSTTIKGAHFPFYRWQSWPQMIESFQ